MYSLHDTLSLVAGLFLPLVAFLLFWGMTRTNRLLPEELGATPLQVSRSQITIDYGFSLLPLGRIALYAEFMVVVSITKAYVIRYESIREVQQHVRLFGSSQIAILRDDEPRSVEFMLRDGDQLMRLLPKNTLVTHF